MQRSSGKTSFCCAAESFQLKATVLETLASAVPLSLHLQEYPVDFDANWAKGRKPWEALGECQQR